jgi:hypothetical protein
MYKNVTVYYDGHKLKRNVEKITEEELISKLKKSEINNKEDKIMKNEKMYNKVMKNYNGDDMVNLDMRQCLLDLYCELKFDEISQYKEIEKLYNRLFRCKKFSSFSNILLKMDDMIESFDKINNFKRNQNLVRTLKLKNWLESNKTGRKFYYYVDCSECGGFKCGGSSDDDREVGETIYLIEGDKYITGIITKKTIYK